MRAHVHQWESDGYESFCIVCGADPRDIEFPEEADE
jgi:hypothetical protein